MLHHTRIFTSSVATLFAVAASTAIATCAAELKSRVESKLLFCFAPTVKFFASTSKFPEVAVAMARGRAAVIGAPEWLTDSFSRECGLTSAGERPAANRNKRNVPVTARILMRVVRQVRTATLIVIASATKWRTNLGPRSRYG